MNWRIRKRKGVSSGVGSFSIPLLLHQPLPSQLGHKDEDDIHEVLKLGVVSFVFGVSDEILGVLSTQLVVLAAVTVLVDAVLIDLRRP